MSVDSLQIQPFGPIASGKTVKIPGSKSISNRALLLAALSGKVLELKGVLRSEDVELMRACLENLGVKISEIDTETLKVEGIKNGFPVKKADLWVGTSGTISRLLISVLGVMPEGDYHIDGTEVMRNRPMKGLTDILKSLGCGITFLGKEDFLPFRMHPRGSCKEYIHADASASSQILSGMLIAAGLHPRDITIKVQSTIRRPYVEMTARMMNHFCATEVQWNEAFDEFVVRGSSSGATIGDAYAIEVDASSSSYFLTLPLVVGGSLKLEGFKKRGLQGDTAFVDILNDLGGSIACDDKDAYAKGRLRMTSDIEYDFYEISDTFMTLAAVAPLLTHRLVLKGLGHTRKQESDRVGAMANELKKLGQEVSIVDDNLIITPSMDALKQSARNGVSIDTYKDHRIAMSFAVLGCYDVLGGQKPWMQINDPGCCSKTFPDFFSKLGSVSGFDGYPDF